MGPKQAICAVRCPSHLGDAVHINCDLRSSLVAGTHCDVGPDASVIASAMPRCGELGLCMLCFSCNIVDCHCIIELPTHGFSECSPNATSDNEKTLVGKVVSNRPQRVNSYLWQL